MVGATAAVEVAWTFVNPYPEPVAVSYVFPLPERAAVRRCTLSRDGHRVAAVLRERGDARQEYARAADGGARAALAEQERQGIFTITLGNLAPAHAVFVPGHLLWQLLTGRRLFDGASDFEGPPVATPLARA